MRKRIIFIVFILLLAGVGGMVYYGQYMNKHAEPSYSGTIEATNANLAFQVPGRVMTVKAAEGQSVTNDQVLAELDAAEFQSRYDQAQANLDKALAAKEQLETVLKISKTTFPADVQRTRANLESARDVLADAKKDALRYEELFRRGVVTQKERDTVKLNYDNAERRVEEAQTLVDQARANLKRIAVAEQDIKTAAAQIMAAQAARDQADLQLEYTRLRSPISGILTSRNVEPGEVVNPSREVMTVSDLTHVDLKIYVNETEIAKVKPGQDVDVKVDTFPDKIYAGTVAYISPEAEFTPKIIQTKKERVKLVYLVKVSIPNPKLELKAGLPADAYLR
ncbi:MAG: efflux RND transporter periplasmic adaptor subunit [Syntrophaceae bacterium]